VVAQASLAERVYGYGMAEEAEVRERDKPVEVKIVRGVEDEEGSMALGAVVEVAAREREIEHSFDSAEVGSANPDSEEQN
jgi:hypothetical protein